MAKLYSAAPADVVQRLNAMKAKFHPDLQQHGVTVGVLMVVEDAEDPEPCLTVGGYPAVAKVKITACRLRAHGLPDAQIDIDLVSWHGLGDAEQDAVLDHELTHLEIDFYRKSGQPKRDSCDRPKLRLRLHDHQYGWFSGVAERHGEASLEVQQYRRHVCEHNQRWFPFAIEEMYGVDEPPVTDAPPAEPAPLKDIHAEQPVSVLTPHGITRQVQSMLEHHGFDVLGDLERLWKRGGRLADYKGFGPEKADSVSDAYVAYHNAHPEVFGKTPEEVAAGQQEQGAA